MIYGFSSQMGNSAISKKVSPELQSPRKLYSASHGRKTTYGAEYKGGDANRIATADYLRGWIGERLKENFAITAQR